MDYKTSACVMTEPHMFMTNLAIGLEYAIITWRNAYSAVEVVAFRNKRIAYDVSRHKHDTRHWTCRTDVMYSSSDVISVMSHANCDSVSWAFDWQQLLGLHQWHLILAVAICRFGKTNVRKVILIPTHLNSKHVAILFPPFCEIPLHFIHCIDTYQHKYVMWR